MSVRSDEVTSRVCTRCLIEKPLEDFSKSSKGKYGVRERCRECESLYHFENRERILQRQKEYREENAERIAEVKALWYENNKEHCKAYAEERAECIAARMREWRERNKEHVSEYGRAYRASEKGRAVGVLKKYRRKQRKAENTLLPEATADEIVQLKREATVCTYCGAILDHNSPVHIDHLVAISKGGGNELQNLVVSCQSCNVSKWNFDVFSWFTKKFNRPMLDLLQLL